jgi:hypothetical protein
LNSKLALAKQNAPLERQAQLIANAMYHARLDATPNMDDASKKKVKFLCLEEARTRTGAKKQQIVIDDDEWNAIQAGAISNHKLTEILSHSDIDRVKQLATPKQSILMGSTETARAKAMFASGYSRAEVARQLGVSLSTLDAAISVPNE